MPFNSDSTIRDLIHHLPKIELHLHLEGCATPEHWQYLIKNGTGENRDIKELAKRFQFKDFTAFLETYRDVIFSYKSAADLRHLTQIALKDLASQNVRYCEMMFTPWFFIEQLGFGFDEIMSEIDAAAKEAELEYNIRMKLIFDGPRQFGNQVVRDVFEMATHDKTGRVVGVGIGGDELKDPARQFIDAFDYARSQGLNVIAHAGETDGEQSMLDAIQLLKVSRIGHGLGIRTNSELEELILANKVTVDVCPTSNLCTQVLDKLENHPILEYLKRGYRVTLNSDDPGFFNTSLEREFKLIAKSHQLNPSHLEALTVNAIKGSFMTKQEKNDLIREVRNVIAAYEDAIGLPERN